MTTALIGFPSLSDAHGDNDSLLRLVEVRDFLGGQGWFDLHQYRMGPEGGFVMHWSRLVDAPIAAIILTASAFGASESTAEILAGSIWPLLLYFACIFILIRAARFFGGAGAVLPAIVIGGTALYFIGTFSPNSFDHHNVQLTLACGALYLAMIAPGKSRAAIGSGICAALMLAVGMETTPYVATLGLTLTVMFLIDGDHERPIARNFGLGFAGTSALVFILTVPTSSWGTADARCDAFSSFQFTLAVLAGGGLATLCSLEVLSGTIWRRSISIVCMAITLGAVMLVFFPQCLAAPYGDLDPRLREFWFAHITEARSLWQLLADDWISVAGRYATPAAALILMALRRRRDDWRREDTLVAALLIVAFVVSAWQVRGSPFSIAFAVIPLSAWIGVWRQHAQKHPSGLASLRMAAAWIISFNFSWTVAAAAAVSIEDRMEPQLDAAASAASCDGRQQFLSLATQPATTVLAVSNLGSPIVMYTDHRALASLYHRNVVGNLLALDAFLGSEADAKAIIKANRVGIVALCPGNAETKLLVTRAPDGFLASLIKGQPPAWLEPIPETAGEPLKLYRVKSG
ncbi:GtrA family protein [Mesorhizobium sp. NPDC059054]|uniref:GtrA family protein n=1 Tax=Mesorhizobium sp. NPDC059054 TaxID=3346711 RepID=UPI0036B6FAD0